MALNVQNQPAQIQMESMIRLNIFMHLHLVRDAENSRGVTWPQSIRIYSYDMIISIKYAARARWQTAVNV